MTVCCLGPITTGTPGQPRYVYGASSLEPTTDSTKGRLTVDAAAAWVAAAAHHGVDRTWISKQPVLSLGETKPARRPNKLISLTAWPCMSSSKALMLRRQYCRIRHADLPFRGYDVPETHWPDTGSSFERRTGRVCCIRTDKAASALSCCVYRPEGESGVITESCIPYHLTTLATSDDSLAHVRLYHRDIICCTKPTIGSTVISQRQHGTAAQIKESCPV